MKHILLSMLNSNKRESKDLESFYIQYNTLKKISNIMYYKRINSFDDLEVTLNEILNELNKIMTTDIIDDHIDESLLMSLFIEVSRVLES